MYLYKYRPDDKYTIQLLTEQRLHFSQPKDFNDPFDCHVTFKDEFMDKLILDRFSQKRPYLANLLKETFPKPTNIPYLREILNQNINKACDNLSICCMSCNADIPPMWAHYADNHSGLCLGFDTTFQGDYLSGLPQKVRYVGHQHLYDSFENLVKLAEDIMTQKSEFWKYEEEVRIIKIPSDVDAEGRITDSFPKEAIVAIFFGLKMSKERQNFYMNLCKQLGYPNITFYKMTMPIDGSYLLVPEKINN